MALKPEQVLVIPTELAKVLAPQPWNVIPALLEQTILTNKSFRERPEAETNTDFKQVIPYLVVRHKNRFLLSQRTKQQEEKRLHDLFSIGQGGHVNDQDFKDKDPILGALMRELREEFHVDRDYSCRPLGLINDDSTDVGKVHLGLVYQVCVASLLLEVAEKGKHIAHWADLDELWATYARMESWSKIVMDHALSPV